MSTLTLKPRFIVRFFMAASDHTCTACQSKIEKTQEFVKLEATSKRDTSKELCPQCYARWSKRNVV